MQANSRQLPLIKLTFPANSLFPSDFGGSPCLYSVPALYFSYIDDYSPRDNLGDVKVPEAPEEKGWDGGFIRRRFRRQGRSRVLME